MRRGKRIAYVLLAATLMTVSALTPMETKAGKSELVLDGESLATSDWNNPEGDVVIEEGKLVFPKESTDYTRFITKTPVKKEEKVANLVSLEASVTFNQLPQGKSFILAFGVSSIESLAGEAGNIEVAFTNNGGIKAGITVYNDDGTTQEIVAPKSCGMSLNREAKVYVVITNEGNIELTVNNQKVGAGKLPVSGEGRFGFLQTGECGAVVSNIEFKHYEYDTPENTNIVEDFEKGSLDASKLTAKMITAVIKYPMGQFVEDYNGNQVLMHLNTSVAYIGTVYKYSNFEMTFDVPYLNIKSEYTDDGLMKKAAFEKLMISIGGEKADWDSARYDLSAEVIALEKGKVYSNSNKEEYTTTLTKNPFEEGKPFSMQVKVVDGMLTVGMKWLEEQNFETVLQYKLKGGTPTGHLHIWAPTPASFALDNIKVTNLDNDANIIETEYRNGKIVKPEDNVPEELERVYAEVEESGTPWYLLIPVTAGATVSAILITVLITRGKKQKKEATINEQ